MYRSVDNVTEAWYNKSVNNVEKSKKQQQVCTKRKENVNMEVYKLWTCDDSSESQLSSTSSEIEKEIDVLRKTFDFVRL